MDSARWLRQSHDVVTSTKSRTAMHRNGIRWRQHILPIRRAGTVEQSLKT
jgi:hypothetical protein